MQRGSFPVQHQSNADLNHVQSASDRAGCFAFKLTESQRQEEKNVIEAHKNSNFGACRDSLKCDTSCSQFSASPTLSTADSTLDLSRSNPATSPISSVERLSAECTETETCTAQPLTTFRQIKSDTTSHKNYKGATSQPQERRNRTKTRLLHSNDGDEDKRRTRESMSRHATDKDVTVAISQPVAQPPRRGSTRWKNADSSPNPNEYGLSSSQIISNTAGKTISKIGEGPSMRRRRRTVSTQDQKPSTSKHSCTLNNDLSTAANLQVTNSQIISSDNLSPKNLVCSASSKKSDQNKLSTTQPSYTKFASDTLHTSPVRSSLRGQGNVQTSTWESIKPSPHPASPSTNKTHSRAAAAEKSPTPFIIDASAEATSRMPTLSRTHARSKVTSKLRQSSTLHVTESSTHVQEQRPSPPSQLVEMSPKSSSCRSKQRESTRPSRRRVSSDKPLSSRNAQETTRDLSSSHCVPSKQSKLLVRELHNYFSSVAPPADDVLHKQYGDNRMSSDFEGQGCTATMNVRHDQSDDDNDDFYDFTDYYDDEYDGDNIGVNDEYIIYCQQNRLQFAGANGEHEIIARYSYQTHPQKITKLYDYARYGNWDMVVSECRQHPRDAKCVYEKDGTTALHLAVMSRTNPAIRDGKKVGYKPASRKVIKELLKACPEAAIIRCCAKKYTPLSYVCLVCDTGYNMEDAVEVMTLILEYAPQSIYVFTDDGLSSLDIHILTYSRVHRQKQEVPSGRRTSTVVLRALLAEAPFLAVARTYGNKVRSPLELLYRCNLNEFKNAADEYDVKKQPERLGSVVSTLSDWWSWKWALLLLKSLDPYDSKVPFCAVRTSARHVGCPIPILKIAMQLYPEQTKVRDPREDLYNLPLHQVASWPCDSSNISGDPFLARRKAKAIELLLEEYPEAARTTNNMGETALQLAVESCTLWDGGLEQLVHACPKALKFKRKLRKVSDVNQNVLSRAFCSENASCIGDDDNDSDNQVQIIEGMYPFMIAAIFSKISENKKHQPIFVCVNESPEDHQQNFIKKDIDSLRIIYGLLRARPDVLQRYIDDLKEESCQN